MCSIWAFMSERKMNWRLNAYSFNTIFYFAYATCYPPVYPYPQYYPYFGHRNQKPPCVIWKVTVTRNELKTNGNNWYIFNLEFLGSSHQKIEHRWYGFFIETSYQKVKITTKVFYLSQKTHPFSFRNHMITETVGLIDESSLLIYSTVLQINHG